jgi:SHS2 domain-containing protein
MPAERIERIEHTADVALRLTANARSDLFLLGAKGLYDVIGQIHPGTEAAERPLTLSASCAEDLFHDWLAEMLYAFDVRREVLESATFTTLTPTHLAACIDWRKVDLERSSLIVEIKAVTYHQLAIRSVGDALQATVVFDV